MNASLAASLGVSATLIAYNAITNLRWPGDRWYVPRNVVVAALLVWFARGAGLSWEDLGLGPEAVAVGWRWARGIVLAILVALAIAAALAPRVAWIRRLLDDRRADLSDRELAWQVFVRIPVGTAAFEELAFRGVLLGLFMASASEAWAVVGSSVVFGLWHVGPSIAAHRQNDRRISPAWSVAVAVLATTVGGVLFAVLRLASSLVAVVIVHWATNALGLLVAATQRRTSRGTL